ncbi:thiolase [Sarocladium strictum]
MATISRIAGQLRAKSPSDIVILSAVRSPITRAFKGGFRDAWPEDLIGPVMRDAVQRAGIQPKHIQDVAIGNVLAELGFAKTGRMALNDAGFPVTTTFHTLNRQCSSSLQALTYISYSILAGQIDVGLAGGVESMSRNYGSKGIPSDVSPSLRASTVKSAQDCLVPMGITSENVASRYGISREDQDVYAFMSHSRAAEAQKAGRFESEIVPVTYQVHDSETGAVMEEREIAADDSIRLDVTLEKLGKLKPAFGPNGASTAGNSSQICDGSSSVVLARRSWADAHDIKPIGRYLATSVSGCEPDEMGIGPVLAIPDLLKKAGLSTKDIDIYELNEAFASQTLHCITELNLDTDKVNPNGGAIALGHPTGATGGRQVATLFNELQRQDKELGVTSMCASTGHGVAALFIRE